jgi:2',3'-cyclic-nucleotide 2'-phosphodiesterase (5'-nucleotidase family)
MMIKSQLRSRVAATAISFAFAMTAPGAEPSQRAAKPGATDVELLMPLDSTNSDVQETSYGNVFADAARVAGGADAAMVPADEFVPKRFERGKHSVGDLQSALRNLNDPTDHIMVLQLTGAQLKSALSRAVSHVPLSFSGFVQVSGMSFRFNPSLSEGKQIAAVQVAGAPLDETRSYTVATTRPMANGSFGYFRNWDDKAIKSDTGKDVGVALAEYLSTRRSVNVMADGRIAKL